MKPLVIITGLDGCLLDSKTNAYDAARPALAALTQAGHALVLCSARTRAETGLLLRRLGMAYPYVVENGGAIVFPPGSFREEVPGALMLEDDRILALGASRSILVTALGRIAAEAGVVVRGFADMSPARLAKLAGISSPAAELALEREYDEPFLVEGGADAHVALAGAAARRGLELSHDGRFHHLTGSNDIGLAVRMLLALYERTRRPFASVGLGIAATDLSLLRAVERPIVVPREGTELDPVLRESLPGAERAPKAGPAGWNEAVLAVLSSRPLPSVGGQ